MDQPAPPSTQPRPADETAKPSRLQSHVKTWHGLLVIVFLSGMAVSFVAYFGLQSNADVVAPGQVISKLAQQDNPSNEAKAVQAAIKAKGKKWVAGDTEISKLSPEERRRRLGLIDTNELMTAEPLTYSATTSAYLLQTIPDALDWRNYGGKNFVTPIKNQGQCGSCWAFGTTATLESAIKIANNLPDNIDLSEQVVVSCSNAGSCNGGYSSTASSFIQTTGVPPESYYPYTAQNGTCSTTKAGWQTAAYKISSFKSVASTVTDMKNALNTTGPIVTSFNIYSDFYYYRSGVYQYATGTYQGGHIVSIVGYDDANQCFIVKNSWGTGWGEAGFFRIGYSEISNVIGFGRSVYAYAAPSNSTSSPVIQPQLILNTPKGSEQWLAGSSYNITWTYGGNPGNITIELINTQSSSSTLIASNVSYSNGSYAWAIPATQAAGTYVVKITSLTSNTVTDTSDSPFTILPLTPTTLTVASPNGGEISKINGILPISWSFAGNSISQVNIDLLKGGKPVKSLFKNVPIGANGNGYTSWKINYRTAGTDFKIRITSSSGAILDESDANFTIGK